MHTNKEIAHLWFDAFNAHNLCNLLALYNDNAKHYSPKLKLHQPETNGLIVGKAALSNWWQDSFERLPTLKYEPNFILVDGNKVFFEYIRKVDGQIDSIIAELLVIENGLIIESKVY